MKLAAALLFTDSRTEGAMPSAKQAIDWDESAEELYARYRSAGEVEERKRLQALWRVRRGETEADAAQQAGIGTRTLVRWLSWYREGGLAEVLRRVPGHGAKGKPHYLSAAQKRELVQRCARGQFRTTGEARDWVEEQWGVSYQESGMYSVLARLGIHPKVPRPQAEKADPQAQDAWKGGDVYVR
jgi:transposase